MRRSRPTHRGARLLAAAVLLAALACLASAQQHAAGEELEQAVVNRREGRYFDRLGDLLRLSLRDGGRGRGKGGPSPPPLGLRAAAAGALRCADEQRRAGWERRRAGLPLYILALGTEGTGHHALRSLLQGVADREYVYEPKIHIAPGENFVAVDGGAHILAQIAQVEAGHSGGPGGNSKVVFDSQHSCPFGPAPRDSAVTRCPDALQLLALHGAGKLDLRVVLLHRDPAAAVLSSMRRGFAEGNAEQQLRTVEFSLGHLEAVFRALPCGLKLLLPFPLLARKPPDLPQVLTRFLGLPHAQPRIDDNLARDRWSYQKDSPSPAAQGHLNSLSLCRNAKEAGPKCTQRVQGSVRNFFLPRLHTWPFLAAMIGARVGEELLPICPSPKGKACIFADSDVTRGRAQLRWRRGTARHRRNVSPQEPVVA